MIIRVALPIIILQWLAVAASAVDCRFLAQSSHLGLAAMAISYRYYLLVLVFSAGVQMALAVRMARAAVDQRSNVLANAGVFCLLLAIPTAAVLYYTPVILERIDVSKQLLQILTPYFHVLAFASIFLWLSGLWRQALIAFDKQKLILYLAITYFLTHVACSYILVLGNFGAPILGLQGVAYSELISLSVVCIISGIVLSTKYKLFSINRLKVYGFYEQWLQSWPVSLMWLSEMFAMLVIVMFIAKTGLNSLASYQIVAQLDLLLLMIPYGVSMACAVVFARTESRSAQKKHLKQALLVTLIPMLIASIVFIVSGRRLLNLLFDPANKTILDTATTLLMITAIYHLFDGVRKVLIGCLRAAGDIRVPLLISSVSFWGIGVGSAYLLRYTSENSVTAIWLCFAAAICFAALAMVLRFKKTYNRSLYHDKK
jgi:multidrug resistance protein, MATE family